MGVHDEETNTIKPLPTIISNGVKYLISSVNSVYDEHSTQDLGVYNPDTDEITLDTEDDDEEEEEEEEYDE